MTHSTLWGYIGSLCFTCHSKFYKYNILKAFRMSLSRLWCLLSKYQASSFVNIYNIITGNEVYFSTLVTDHVILVIIILIINK